ncbi:MAG: hypothetical protein A2W85_01470 [Bacteroidetes bacterium GWF2_41_31]|nr:MAG: hypothetical protein A2W85_01470 [Bacteroidetes bacterium GWF2_41_31]
MMKSNIDLSADVKQISNDPFLRRIEVQNTVIKKILAKIDQVPDTEDDLKTEDEMNLISFGNDGQDDQKQEKGK